MIKKIILLSYKNMYFCKKKMRIKILYILLVLFSIIISSCGVYHEPCEGVSEVQINKSNS